MRLCADVIFPSDHDCFIFSDAERLFDSDKFDFLTLSAISGFFIGLRERIRADMFLRSSSDICDDLTNSPEARRALVCADSAS